MGNSIATAMVEKQKEVQKEMQKEMVKIQMENMTKGQERQRRVMIAQQMAVTRERLWWMGGFGTFVTLGFFGYAHTNKSVSKPALLPLLAYWTVVCYQIDFAYGNKAERINKYYDEIIHDNRYWFVPLQPDNKQEQSTADTTSKTQP